LLVAVAEAVMAPRILRRLDGPIQQVRQLPIFKVALVAQAGMEDKAARIMFMGMVVAELVSIVPGEMVLEPVAVLDTEGRLILRSQVALLVLVGVEPVDLVVAGAAVVGMAGAAAVEAFPEEEVAQTVPQLQVVEVALM
jgi:hypothetical protein